MARHGIRGLCDLKRPWRLFLLGLALVGGLACGFRSELILLMLTFICVFYWEGLFQARYVMLLLAGMLLIGGLVLPFARKLPLGMQRTLTFLPINLDPMVRSDAEGSINWRLEIWRQLMPDIPKYLIKGKGYGIDPGDLYMSIVSGFTHNATGEHSSVVTGDYHNGPLSVIIPFGIFGSIAFLWFLGASLRVLYLYYRFGDPALKLINTFLLAFFIVRIFSFFFLFGSFYSDMYLFTGLIGLGVSLNGEVRSSAKVEESLELVEETY